MSAALLLTACTTADEPGSAARPSPNPAAPAPATTPPPPPTPTPTPEPTFDVRAAERAVADLAAGGPREGTSAAFAAAADDVAETLRDLGYQVRRQPVPVPAGVSWGVPVPAGRSINVIATAPGTRLTEPYLVVGAHLDTVPQSPGAVDNASGIAVLLEVARLAAQAPPPRPVVLLAFGAEEPRGPGDDLHHFGSQEFVRNLTERQRDALLGAIAVDTVGVSPAVPICTAVPGDDPFTTSVRRAAERSGVPVRPCENRLSDHWSFVRNGLPGVRVGLAGVQEYPQYHSPADRPGIIDRVALRRAGQAVWAAVSSRSTGR